MYYYIVNDNQLKVCFPTKSIYKTKYYLEEETRLCLACGIMSGASSLVMLSEGYYPSSQHHQTLAPGEDNPGDNKENVVKSAPIFEAIKSG